jgi:hypothetical protein
VALFVVGAVTLEEVSSREALGADLEFVLVQTVRGIRRGDAHHR